MMTVQRLGQTPIMDGQANVANRLAMHSVTINGRRTTMRLEPSIWNALSRIAEDQRLTVNQLCSRIDGSRGEMAMTAAVRAYVVFYLQKMPLGASGSGQMQSIDAILEGLGSAYAKGELLRIRIARGEDVLVKIAIHPVVLERSGSGSIANIYQEWVRQRDQLHHLPRITELSDHLLRRAAGETMLSVVDLAAGGSLAQPHQDPVMARNMYNTDQRSQPVLRTAFQQDMLAVECCAEPIYQVNQIRLGGSEQVYKRLLLPLSDSGSDVTRVLVAAVGVGNEVRAAVG